MNKTIIFYSSKTGFSRRYAQWLAEELGCQAVPFRGRKQINLSEYDTILLSGGLYAGQMSGLKRLKKLLPALEKKRVAAIAVGCAPPDNSGLPESMKKLFGDIPQIHGFYCQGGLDYEHMGWIDRAMMAMLRSMLKKQPDKKDMLEGISHSFDGARKEYLEPVIHWVRHG